jgi:hypothetical protein
MGWIDWVVLASSVVLIIGCALYTRSYARNVADFVAAGRVAGGYLICNAKGEAGSGIANTLSKFQYLFISGFSWWDAVSMPVRLLVGMSGFVFYRYRQTRAMTLGQFFEMRYSRRRCYHPPVLLGFNEDFTPMDRLVAGAILVWSIFWLWVVLIGTAWKIVRPWPTRVWADFWFVSGVVIPLIIATLTFFWFGFGGVLDLRILFSRLSTARLTAHDNSFPCVGLNHLKASDLAAEQLLSLGLKHFGFCGRPIGKNPGLDQRAHAFQACIRAAGRDCALFPARKSGRDARQGWEQEQEHLAAWILSLPKPVGIMTSNDERGLPLLDACRRRGAGVPDEVAVGGVDNDEHLCDLSISPLTSVDVNTEQIGYEEAKLLETMMAGEVPQATTHMKAASGIVNDIGGAT